MSCLVDLERRLAAIHSNGRSSDKRSFFRGDEDDSVGYLCRPADPLKGNSGHHGSPSVLVRPDESAEQLGLDRPGRDDIDAMPVSAPVISTTGVLVMSQRYLLLAASASARPLGFLVSPSSATE